MIYEEINPLCDSFDETFHLNLMWKKKNTGAFVHKWSKTNDLLKCNLIWMNRNIFSTQNRSWHENKTFSILSIRYVKSFPREKIELKSSIFHFVFDVVVLFLQVYFPNEQRYVNRQDFERLLLILYFFIRIVDKKWCTWTFNEGSFINVKTRRIIIKDKKDLLKVCIFLSLHLIKESVVLNVLIIVSKNLRVEMRRKMKIFIRIVILFEMFCFVEEHRVLTVNDVYLRYFSLLLNCFAND